MKDSSKTNSSNSFAEKLLEWFDQHGRKDLPWQQDKTPYRVWVSEIMLQQTQVQSAIGYYNRFMTRFPDIQALATADIDEVLEHWSGLGYYARARNLHKTAQLVVNEHEGILPNHHDDLIALPGIGRSTAGAIRSIAFKENATILDGNVKRVLCRFDQVETWSGERETEKQLWLRAEELTPSHRNEDYTQAIMDLGATCCTRSKPNCELCPMNTDCKANLNGLQTKLPVSKPKKEKPTKHRWLLEIRSEAGILIEKRPPTGIWGGLYTLPEFDYEMTLDNLLAATEHEFDVRIESHTKLESFKHVFSHYTVIMHPVAIEATPSVGTKVKEDNALHWKEQQTILKLGLPAPIKKFLQRSCSQVELSLE